MSMYGPPYVTGITSDTSKGAKQSFRKETDVNLIINRFEKTGLLTPVDSRPPFYMDVSEVGDYRSALENVRRADALFMALPSPVRAEFGNDAAAFLDFCTDPVNEDRMREMGLLPALPEAAEAAVVPPAEPEVAESGE